MQFETIADPIDFRDATAALLADEARHNLILGILGNLIDHPDTYEDYRLFVLRSGDEEVACALMTPPYRVIVADCEDSRALNGLVQGIIDTHPEVPGAIGNRPTIDRFVGLWKNKTGGDAELAMAQGVFAAGRITQPRPTAGEPRIAVEADLDLVLDWFDAFVAEAIPDEPRDEERLRRVLLQRLRAEVWARVWLWEVAGEPVAMSAHTNPVGRGVRINAVYTPPAHRGSGYASNLVAAQSQWLLDHGRDFCFLYTDLANPTSNKIYEAIGYQRVAEAASYAFVNPAT